MNMTMILIFTIIVLLKLWLNHLKLKANLKGIINMMFFLFSNLSLMLTHTKMALILYSIYIQNDTICFLNI